MGTDSISLTDFSGSYTRETGQSFLDDDESSIIPGSYTHATLDDDTITGGIFERVVLRLGSLFFCNLTEDDRCLSVKHGCQSVPTTTRY
jgi:hypothetical protein